MQIEQIPEDAFFNGLNQRIAELAAEIGDTAEKIQNKPDSSTYHIDNFFHPLQAMRKLQRIRDKARAFKENEAEDVIYVKKLSKNEQPKYFYLPESQYDSSRVADAIKKMERMQQTDTDLGYIG